MVSDARISKKPLQAVKITTEQRSLAADPRAFDAKIVRSGLDFMSRFTRPFNDADVCQAASSYAWVPGIICLRALDVGHAIKPYELTKPKTGDECNTLALRLRLAIDGLQAPARAKAHPDLNNWLAKKITGLEFSVHPVYRSGAWLRVEIPVLKSLEQCVAYSIFLMIEDRWEFTDRVRFCPYSKQPGQEHWFLDVDDNGAPNIGAARTFCSDEHGNAYRQREWRKQQAAAKHK
jgi:hypothetical protein